MRDRQTTTYAIPVKPPSREETAGIFFGMLRLNGIHCASCACSSSSSMNGTDGEQYIVCGRGTGGLRPTTFLCNEWSATSQSGE